MEKYPPYQSIFSKLSYGESQMLDKAFYEEEVKRLCLAFEQQVCILAIEQPYPHYLFHYKLFTHQAIYPGFAVPLWCFLRLHEVEGAGDKEPDVDF